MAFVVTDACINCKFMDCMTVCPVNCFYEGKMMLVIKQIECIDCGSCEPLCPSEAIIADIDDESGEWAAFNDKYAELWPRVTSRSDTPPTGRQAYRL